MEHLSYFLYPVRVKNYNSCIVLGPILFQKKTQVLEKDSVDLKHQSLSSLLFSVGHNDMQVSWFNDCVYILFHSNLLPVMSAIKYSSEQRTFVATCLSTKFMNILVHLAKRNSLLSISWRITSGKSTRVRRRVNVNVVAQTSLHLIHIAAIWEWNTAVYWGRTMHL